MKAEQEEETEGKRTEKKRREKKKQTKKMKKKERKKMKRMSEHQLGEKRMFDHCVSVVSFLCLLMKNSPPNLANQRNELQDKKKEEKKM